MRPCETIDEFLEMNRQFYSPSAFLSVLRTKSDETFCDLTKNFVMSCFRPMLVKLINVDTNEVEIYIKKEDYTTLAASEIYNILDIQVSEKFKELPFDFEHEKQECERMKIDHSEYNSRFMNNLDGRIGLKLTYELETLISANHYLDDYSYIVYKMKNL